jgi:putative heme-binding domain-containing protein
LTEEQLLSQLTSPSHTWRLATQREILRRGDNAVFDAGLVKLIDSNQPLAVRVAAVFTLKLLQGNKADAALSAAALKSELREFALRAMIDRKNDKDVPVKPLIDALTDANPRVRLVGAWGLGRVGSAQSAPAILPLTADSDFLVAHVAVKALVALNATDVCLNAVEPSTSPGVTLGALNVLKEIHDEKVVKGLIERAPKLADASTRSAAWRALCRLCYQEAEWDGGWWGTRPDRAGPYYKNAEWAGSEAVKTALHGALTTEKPEVIAALIVDLQKHQISFPEMPGIITKLAQTDPGFQGIQIEMLSTAKKLDAGQIATLQSLATNEKASASIRAKATRVLTKEPGNAPAMDAAADAIAPLLSLQQGAPELITLRDEFLHDPQFAKHVGYFAKLGESDSPAKKELAYSVLMNLAGSRLVKAEYKKSAADDLDSAWAKPANAIALLHAVGRMHADAYGDKVSSFLTDKNPAVVQAASMADETLRRKHGVPSTVTLIEAMKYEDVLAAVLKMKGDAVAGHDLFQRQGCIACHTVSPKEPQKGPMLGGISGRYNRSELCESIVKPSAKIAQGFETQWFKTSDGEVLDGFVSRESGDEVEVRNATGQAIVLKKANIVKRGKRDFSIMPEGLVAKLTPQDLANLIGYLESTSGK